MERQQAGESIRMGKMGHNCKAQEMGRMGHKRLDLFAKALAAKLGWQFITSHSLWTRVAYDEYISPENTMDWFRRDHRVSGSLSIIWKAVLTSLPLIRYGLTWRIHQRSAVHIGVDPWIGCGNAHRLPAELIAFLVDQGLSHLSHITDQTNSTLF